MPLVLHTNDRQTVKLNVRAESTVMMQGTDLSYTFDAAGRLVGAFREGRNYRRSLPNRVLEKQSGPRPGLSGRLRRFLPPTEVAALETQAYAFARDLPTRVPTPLPSPATAALARIATYSYARLERERATFERIYRPVSILPPDQYLALYLQATEGCSYNECSFCGLYRDRRFHVKTPAEFRQHLEDVCAFFGPGLALRRTLFLGDANALMLPQPQLLDLLDEVNRAFELTPAGLAPAARRAWEKEHPVHFDGLYSFIDAFTTRRKTAADFAELAARGLRRVYIGLESGDPALLRFLGKPNTPEDVTALVRTLKQGGVATGLVVLVGAGGDEYSAAHVRATAELLNALPLDAGDLIYLSELVDAPGSTYAERAAEAGLRALSADELDAQARALRAALSFQDPANRPKVSYYDLREFIY